VNRLIVTTVVVGGIALAVGATLAFAGKPGGGGTSTANYPDLRAVVPAHVQLVNSGRRCASRTGSRTPAGARGRCVRSPSSVPPR
jgi:hypothetical protein